MPEAQHIHVNGESMSVPTDCTVEILLGILEISHKRIAVAVTRDVVSRRHFSDIVVHGGDRIEILEAVGGG